MKFINSKAIAEVVLKRVRLNRPVYPVQRAMQRLLVEKRPRCHAGWFFMGPQSTIPEGKGGIVRNIALTVQGIEQNKKLSLDNAVSILNWIKQVMQAFNLGLPDLLPLPHDRSVLEARTCTCAIIDSLLPFLPSFLPSHSLPFLTFDI